MLRDGGLGRIPRIVLLLWLGVMILNTWVLASGRGLTYGLGEVSEDRVYKQATQAIIQYYRQVASAAGVQNEKAVKTALAGMQKTAQGQAGTDALTDLLTHVGSVEAAIGSEMRKRYRETVLKIIRADPQARRGDQVSTVLIIGQEVIEGKELLSSTTLQRLKEAAALETMTELVGVGVKAGEVSILPPARELQYYETMELELEEMGRRLDGVRRATGQMAIAGPGVIIQAGDAPGGYLWEEIVHEQDIREIVNSLYFAGARGVEVGGRRFGAGGWVRCVGPVVVVNGKTVAANPVVIKAVGQPQQLAKSLKELQEIFAQTGKRLDIERVEHLELVPLAGSRTGLADHQEAVIVMEGEADD